MIERQQEPTADPGDVNRLRIELNMRKPPMVILMHGETGAGKNAVAEILAKRGFVQMAFADEVRRLLDIFNPIVDTYEDMTGPEGNRYYGAFPLRLRDVIYGPAPEHLLWHQKTKFGLGWDEAKRKYPEVRRIQQVFATDVVRHEISDRYWAGVIMKKILELPEGMNAVVSDLRFGTEVNTLFLFNPVVWWVQREDNPHRLTGDAAKHVSEAWHPAPGTYDVVPNNGSLADLDVEVRHMLAALLDPEAPHGLND